MDTVYRQLDYLADQVDKVEKMMVDPVEFGRLQADVHTLKADMADLKGDVKSLLELANQGKGGLWMFRTAYVAAGGLLVWALEHFIGKALK